MTTPYLGVSSPPYGVIPYPDKERSRLIPSNIDQEAESSRLLQELLLSAAGFPSDKPPAFEDGGEFDEGIGGGVPLNEPLPGVSDDMEEVKRELNEAIQKDMEMPSIISAQDEYFE